MYVKGCMNYWLGHTTMFPSFGVGPCFQGMCSSALPLLSPSSFKFAVQSHSRICSPPNVHSPFYEPPLKPLPKFSWPCIPKFIAGKGTSKLRCLVARANSYGQGPCSATVLSQCPKATTLGNSECWHQSHRLCQPQLALQRD